MTKNLPNWASLVPADIETFNKIRLVAVDLDGTLVESGKIGNCNLNTIKKLVNSIEHYNVKFTIATGRILAGAEKVLTELEIADSIPKILYNGSVIAIGTELNNAKPIRIRTINSSSLLEILDCLKYADTCVLAYEFPSFKERSLFSISHKEIVYGWSRLAHYSHEYNGLKITWIDDWRVIPNFFEPSAILVQIHNPADAPIIHKILSSITSITTTQSSSKYVEIRPPKSNKGEAIGFIAKYLNIGLDSVLSIGDNDKRCEIVFSGHVGRSQPRFTLLPVTGFR